MKIKTIKSKKEYQAALKRLDEIFDAPANTNEGDEAELLTLVIDVYENENFPIEAPDPIEAIKIRMEEMGLKQTDLIGIIGEKGKVSEVLNRRRKLNLNMIRRINKRLHIPPSVLIQEYKLSA
ncbi:MAG: transcriptional regulator [Cytophagales bacterium]|jgi:HTH-type transcriptional regulator/antitoxin HigA|nr:transcriptional regulator [Cytophagales bacterium]MCE2894439.1 transcriptional regulator [Flammeovirgaceae bacterium]MCA6366391.1 transcriptional regulator [Cytophagales bacterium]MCA6371190.1 transcriptional regulator [Cytophagales bacterium]MCA6374685.1 transcriptional regulator [Cytophagales bacterium]